MACLVGWAPVMLDGKFPEGGGCRGAGQRSAGLNPLLTCEEQLGE